MVSNHNYYIDAIALYSLNMFAEEAEESFESFLHNLDKNKIEMRDGGLIVGYCIVAAVVAELVN